MRHGKWFCNPLIFHKSLLAENYGEFRQVILEVIEKQRKVTCRNYGQCIPPYPPTRTYARAREAARIRALTETRSLR